MKFLFLLATIFTSASAFAEWVSPSNLNPSRLCERQYCEREDGSNPFKQVCQNLGDDGTDASKTYLVHLTRACDCPCNLGFLPSTTAVANDSSNGE